MPQFSAARSCRPGIRATSHEGRWSHSCGCCHSVCWGWHSHACCRYAYSGSIHRQPFMLFRTAHSSGPARLVPRNPSAAAADITAQGSNVVFGGSSYSTLRAQRAGSYHGRRLPSFSIDGELRIESRDGFLLLTLSMPLERYVAAVLQGESAGFKSGEALKAMAVAARTYAVHFDSRHRSEGFDFCDTTHCQDVRLGNESARVLAAVDGNGGRIAVVCGASGGHLLPPQLRR